MALPVHSMAYRSNCSRLDSNLCADEAALQAQIVLCRDEQEKLHKDISEVERLLEQCNKSRKVTDDALSLHDVEMAKLLAREATLKTEEAAAKQEVDASKKKSRQRCRAKLGYGTRKRQGV